MLFGTKVQQRLSRSCYKRLTNLVSDNSLGGLVIDWHLANAEMCESTANDFVEPISNYEPTYAYVA